jgi:hypothetical protein
MALFTLEEYLMKLKFQRELTDEQLREELEEENEQRSKLGKPKIGLKEWKEKRVKRVKQVG